MDTAEFDKTWKELFKERTTLVETRTTLETELVEVRNKISHLDEVLSHLAPLAGVDWYNRGGDDVSGLGLTGAIRFILQYSQERLSAQDIRRLLMEKEYDLSSLSAPMASIYKILARLVDAAEVEREMEEGRVYFKWIHPPISDEDIPF
jgi:hypothetical protein